MQKPKTTFTFRNEFKTEECLMSSNNSDFASENTNQAEVRVGSIVSVEASENAYIVCLI